MHIELNLVSVFFRGGILVLFCVQVYRLFLKTLLKDRLESELKRMRNEQIECIEKDNLLGSTKKRLEGQISQQKVLFARLEVKYRMCVEAYNRELLQREAESAIRVQKMTDLHSKQQTYVVQRSALKEMIPLVMHDSTQRLAAQYRAEEGLLAMERYVKGLK